MPFEFKPKDEGDAFFLSITFTTKEVEITSKKEVNPFSRTKQRRREVREWSSEGWQAQSGWMQTPVCQQGRNDGPRQLHRASGKKFQMVCRMWGPLIKDKKKHVAKKSCRASTKREDEVLLLAEKMKNSRS